jgi:hypothetical protein
VGIQFTRFTSKDLQFVEWLIFEKSREYFSNWFPNEQTPAA